MIEVLDLRQCKIVGANQRYAFASKKVLTQEYRDFVYYVFSKTTRPPIKLFGEKIKLQIHVTTNLDIDNALKGIIDGVSTALGFNDNKIMMLEVFKTNKLKRKDSDSIRVYLEVL